MIKTIKKHLGLIFLLSILILGLFLRRDNLYTWPRLGATFDEYAWTWQGVNLIQKGIPISWSPHPQYKSYKEIVYQETHFRLVTPFLEHPPVFGLVAGSFALLNGSKDMYHVTINNIRPLAVILGLISIALVYFLAREIYDKKIAVLSALLYAVIPSVVVGSRIVQNENFFIPIWLASLLLVARYIRLKKLIYLIAAAILCYVVVLAKIPWVAAPGSIFLIFIYLKKYKEAILFFILPILSLLTFFVYGMFYDLSLFLNLWTLQLNRYDITFNSVFALFTEPFLVDRFTIDGWIYFGWFAFMLLLLKDLKKNYIVVFALLSYFAIFIFGIPNEAGHGWYRYPFYPFLIISTAIFIYDYFKKNLLLTFFFIIFIGTSMLQLSYGVKFGFSFLVFRLFLISTSIILLPILFKSKKLKGLANAYMSFMFVFLILLSMWAVSQYNEQ